MKQLNNIKSEVYLSTYDNSDLLLPVSEEYKGMDNICVVVKFGDTVVKISPNNTCECTWNEAMEKHRDRLISPAFWQMVGNVHYKVNETLEMLNHDPLEWVWTDLQYSGLSAWLYNGTLGTMRAFSKYFSGSVREAKVFKI